MDDINHTNGNGRTPDPHNFDELEELNPTPVRFTVKGKALIAQELEHKDYVLAQRAMASLQAIVLKTQAAGSIDDEFVERLDVETRKLLMLLFGPFNPWLGELDEKAHRKDVVAWQEREGNDHVQGRGDFPEPKLKVGVFFDGLTERKLSRLTAEAFLIQQQFVASEEQKAKEAGVDTAPFEKALSSGASSTSASPSGSS